MSDAQDVAILAGGCFWGMQHALRGCPGVLSTCVGFTGGDVANATYRNQGTHAEAVKIIFASETTNFRALLEFFFDIHDPTTRDRQGNDVGARYRSAIFYTSEAQKHVAENMIATLDASGRWPDKIVTELVPAGAFWKAEAEHQNILDR